MRIILAVRMRMQLALIGEEVAANKTTLAQIVQTISDTICDRWEAGLNHGVFLISEGLADFIPEVCHETRKQFLYATYLSVI